MKFRGLFAAVLVAVGVLLTGCTTAEQNKKPVLLVVDPYVSLNLKDGPAAARRVLADSARLAQAGGQYTVRRKGFFEAGFDEAMAQLTYRRTALLDDAERVALASALGVDVLVLTDLLPNVTVPGYRTYQRLIDASTGEQLPGLDASRPEPRNPSPRLDLSGAWAAGWARAPELVPEAASWKAALEAARAAGAFDEAARLTDLLIDRVRFSDKGDWLRKFVDAEAQWSREDLLVRSLVATLSGGRGTAREEEILRVGFLTTLRGLAPTSRAGARYEVAIAFQARFGVELDAALARLPLVLAAGGTFSMGSEDGEADEKPVHRVSVSDFLLGLTEVTQAQYLLVTGFNPSLFTQSAEALRQPVERVTWYDAVEFCNKLSIKDGLEPVYVLTGRNPAKGYPIKAAEVTWDRKKTGYRLPTEAEWEWAARGGVLSQGTLLAGGEVPEQVAWTDGTTAGPGPVAVKAANELGAYDLSGNVWEWCADWYGKYTAGEQDNPEGPLVGVLKVGRGGSWHAAAWNARVTTRSYDNPGARGNNIGFRVVRSLTPP